MDKLENKIETDKCSLLKKNYMDCITLNKYILGKVNDNTCSRFKNIYKKKCN